MGSESAKASLKESAKNFNWDTVPARWPPVNQRHAYPVVWMASVSCAAGAFTATSTAVPRVVVTSM